MRLKYQLRGLGVGVILTAALLMIFSDEGEVSAKVDGTEMVANTENEITEASEGFADIITEEVSTIVEEGTVEEVESTVEMETIIDEEQTIQTEVEEMFSSVIEEQIEETVEETKQEETLENDLTDVVKIKIVGGDDSGTVARKLQVAGLVDNASEFDAYLMQHGYDKKISVGEKEIPRDATWIEIAEKISSR